MRVASKTPDDNASMVAQALIFLIRVYQWTISPLLGPSCRFEPSCSRYAVECLRLHGATKGSYLAVRRILKCHPFHPGGYDPPPPPKDSGKSHARVIPLPNDS